MMISKMFKLVANGVFFIASVLGGLIFTLGLIFVGYVIPLHVIVWLFNL